MTREELFKENQETMASLKDPSMLERFIGTMAKYHKYPLRAQLSIFRHARKTDTALADASVWEQVFGTPVSQDAEGVPIIGEDGERTMLYDISDTQAGKEHPELSRSLVWTYDPERLQGYMDSHFRGQGSMKERIRSFMELYAAMNDQPVPAVHAAEAIVLRRLGMDPGELPQEELPAMAQENTLALANQMAQDVLNPIGSFLRQEESRARRQEQEKEMQEHDPAGNREKELRQVGRDAQGVPDAGEASAVAGDERGAGRGRVPQGNPAGDGGESGASDAGNPAGAESDGSREGRESDAVDLGDGAGTEIHAGNPAAGTLQINGRSFSFSLPDKGEKGAEAVRLAMTGLSQSFEKDNGARIQDYRQAMDILFSSAMELEREEDRRSSAFAYDRELRAMLSVSAKRLRKEQKEKRRQKAEPAFVAMDLFSDFGEAPQTAAPALKAETAEEAPAEENQRTRKPEQDGEPDASGSKEEQEEQEEAEPPIDEETITFRKHDILKDNLAAIRVLQELEEKHRSPTSPERETLERYHGFGGVPDVFDEKKEAFSPEREELKTLLSKSEYLHARHSTLTAFYTPEPVVKGIWQGLKSLGFQEGNILDPSAGTGRFFSGMPEDIRVKSDLSAMEIDPITSRIAGALNPDAHVYLQGFEQNRFPEGAFDLAISNVPFDNTRILADPKYRKESPLIHDYFSMKMLDMTRPGGLAVLITSKGTMDKANAKVRQELAKKADLVQALRLPSSAFHGAGTDTTTDILILRRREKERTELPDWVQTEKVTLNGHEARINRYFLEHPENVLGTLQAKSTPWGFDASCQEDKEKFPSLGGAIASHMKALGTIYQPSQEALPLPEQEKAGIKGLPFGFYEDDKKELIYVTPDGRKTYPEVTEEGAKKIRMAMAVRDALRRLFEEERAACPDDLLALRQGELRLAYDAYAEAYGPMALDKEGKQYLSEDAAYPLLCSLEIIEDGKVKGLSDVFTKRTIAVKNTPSHTDTPEDALAVSMTEKGKVDLSYMSGLLGKTEAEIAEDLTRKGLIFRQLENSKGDYVLREEYLSGDVRGKLRMLYAKLEAEQEAVLQKAQRETLPKVFEGLGDTESLQERWNALSGDGGNRLRSLVRKENRDLIYGKLSEYYLASEIMRKLRLYAGEQEGKSEEDKRNAEDTLAYLDSPRGWLDALKHGAGIHYLASSPTAKMFFRFIRERMGKEYLSTSFDETSSLELMYLEKEVGKFEAGDPDAFSNQGGTAEWESFRSEEEKKIARKAAETQETESIQALRHNIEALEAVKPRDLTKDEIGISLGASWVPDTDIKQFIMDTFNLARGQVSLSYSSVSGRWDLRVPSYACSGDLINTVYGTDDLNAIQLTTKILGLKEPKVTKKIEVKDPKTGEMKEKEIVDFKRTMLAQQKMENIRQAFKKWVFDDPKRTERLVSLYNERFNRIVPREYDGSHLTFPGMNPSITLRKHQKDAVAHTLYGGNTLLAHVVGAGKTFEMIASGMEAKRLGLCHKSLYVMPKHLTEQFGGEFLRLYPDAKVLIADNDRDFTPEGRAAFAAKIALHDYDAVIMSYKQFEKIPLSPNEARRADERRLHELLEYKEEASKNYFSVKEYERAVAQLKAKIEEEKGQQKKDDTLYFEDLGIDRLYVDEAHSFKNLPTTTKMANVSGVKTGKSERATDMFRKVQYLNGLTGCKGVVMATGTPVSNSMTELYTFERYLQPDALEKAGLRHFDDWATTFGSIEAGLELSPEGKYRTKTRFSKFYNLPELMNMVKQVADIKTADMLNLPVPKANYKAIQVPPSATQKAMLKDIQNRAEKIHDGNPEQRVNKKGEPYDDNFLNLSQESRNLSLDPRLVDPQAPAGEYTKVDACAENVARIYEETKENLGTQIIFSDIGTPKSDRKIYTVYRDLKEKLIGKGIDPKEIAIIHDFDKPEQKEALFQKVREGKVRVLMGSTEKLGTGTNVQTRLAASHDLDVPWRPADLEQRSGRTIRQGNQNEEVSIYRYITEGTFDAYMWQNNENKQKFISQVMTSRTPAREAEDIDEKVLSFADYKALSTGNPLFKEKMQLENDVMGLRAERSAYIDRQEKIRKELPAMEKKLSDTVRKKELIEKDIAAFGKVKNPSEGVPSPVTIGKEEFKDAGSIGKALSKAAGAVLASPEQRISCRYKDMPAEIFLDTYKHVMFSLHGTGASYLFPIGKTTPEENAKRLSEVEGSSLLQGAGSVLSSITQDIAYLEKECKEAGDMLKNPFPNEALLEKKSERLREINLKLDDSETDERERKARLDAIRDQKESGTSIGRAFSTIAHKLLKKNSEWTAELDQKAASVLQKSGWDREAIAQALQAYSPSVPDADAAGKAAESAFQPCR